MRMVLFLASFSLIFCSNCGLLMTAGAAYYLSTKEKTQQISLVKISDITPLDGVKGRSYSITFEATKGTSPYIWETIETNIPEGMELNPSTGELSGIPIEYGVFDFYITVRDSKLTTDIKAVSIEIFDTLTFQNNSVLMDGSKGKAYNVSLQVSGGKPTYIFSLNSGELPINLTLSEDGIISGNVDLGASLINNFSILCEDSNEEYLKQTETKSFTINIEDESLEMITPISTDVLIAGDYFLVSWNTNGFIPNVNLELWKNSIKYSDIILNYSNSGIYLFLLDNSIPKGSNYTIKVINKDNTLILSESDIFSIDWKIEVSNPEEGIEIELGTSFNINWVTYGSVSEVNLELWKDNIFSSNIDLNIINENHFLWNVGFDLPYGNTLTIKVISSLDNSIVGESLSFILSPKNNVFVAGIFNDGVNNYGHIKRFSSLGNEDINWNKTLSTSSIIYSTTIDIDYNVYICGSYLNGATYDIFIKKYNLYGVEDTVNWNKTINYTGLDEALDIKINNNNEIFIVGRSQESANYYMLIKKFDSQGVEDTLNWNKRVYLTPKSNLTSIGFDSFGSIYVTGFSGGTEYHWFTTKFSSEGIEDTVNWCKSWYSSSTVCKSQEVKIDSNDNIYITGKNYNTYTLKKYNTDGIEDTLNWNKAYSYNTYAESSYGITFDSENNIYTSGFYLPSITDYNWWLKKHSENGIEDTTNWNKTYGTGTGTEIAYSIESNSNNNIYVVGSIIESTNQNWCIKKFSSNGVEDTTNWNKTCGLSGLDIPYEVSIIK